MLKLTDTVASKVRPAIAALPETDRLVAHALIQGKGKRELSDLLGVTEKQAEARVAAVIPGIALLAFRRRAEVAPHIVGELVGITPDLERGLYRVVHDNLAHERQDGSATFAVMAHGGASAGLFYGDLRPSGEWLDVAPAEVN